MRDDSSARRRAQPTGSLSSNEAAVSDDLPTPRMPPPSDELSEIDGESCETTTDEAHETEPQLPAPAPLLTVINIEAPPRQRANGRLAQVMFLMGLGSVVGLAVHAVQPHLASALHDLGACLAVFTATR